MGMMIIIMGIMGLFVGMQLKSMCYSCGLDVENVYAIARKIFFYVLYTFFIGIIVLLILGMVSIVLVTLF